MGKEADAQRRTANHIGRGAQHNLWPDIHDTQKENMAAYITTNLGDKTWLRN